MKLNFFIDTLKDELVTFEMQYRKQYSADKEAYPLERTEDDWNQEFDAWRLLRQED